MERWKSTIFRRFLRWQHFPGRGWDLDENGRNGRKWHLAQQITYHVTLYIFQQITHHVIM